MLIKLQNTSCYEENEQSFKKVSILNEIDDYNTEQQHIYNLSLLQVLQ